MLELNVYDTDLTLQGIIDTYSSLLWTRKFYTPSTVELQCPATENNLALLKQYRIVEREDTNECFYIRSLTITEDSENGGIITASGNSLTQVLYNRATLSVPAYSAKTIITANCIDSPVLARNFAFLKVDDALDTIALEDSFEYGDKSIGELLELKLRELKKGLTAVFDHTLNKVVLTLLTGVDRSINQTVNPQAVFSVEFDNLLSCTYSKSDVDGATVALARMYVPEMNGDPAHNRYFEQDNGARGLERIEKGMIITAHFYTDENTNVMFLAFEQAQADFDSLAKDLSKGITENFEGEINTKSGYRTDWDLGDTVSLVRADWGITQTSQIQEITEVFDHTTNAVSAVFGEPNLTILDRLRRF